MIWPALRRAVLLAAVVVALAGAVLALWRNVSSNHETAETIAAELSCPACQGESVAHSASPIAAAMREAIAAQLAQGRSPEEVRQWFVARYGPQVLADRPATRWGLLVWLLPAAAAAAGAWILVRRLRPQPVRARPASVRPASGRRIAASRIWDLLAVSLLALATAVAVASPHPSPPAARASLADSLALASSLEGQGRFAEAANVYREIADQQPDQATRLRLAFCLLRSGQFAPAAQAAAGVVDEAPTNAQAVLLLGLAQRAQGLPEATATLQRFLALDPDNGAAPEIRRLLPGPS